MDDDYVEKIERMVKEYLLDNNPVRRSTNKVKRMRQLKVKMSIIEDEYFDDD